RVLATARDDGPPVGVAGRNIFMSRNHTRGESLVSDMGAAVALRTAYSGPAGAGADTSYRSGGLDDGSLDDPIGRRGRRAGCAFHVLLPGSIVGRLGSALHRGWECPDVGIVRWEAQRQWIRACPQSQLRAGDYSGMRICRAESV